LQVQDAPQWHVRFSLRIYPRAFYIELIPREYVTFLQPRKVELFSYWTVISTPRATVPSNTAAQEPRVLEMLQKNWFTRPIFFVQVAVFAKHLQGFL